MKVHNCQTMRCAEQEFIDSGFMSSDELMDYAIDSARIQLKLDPFFRTIAERFAHVVVYAGKGKNAGDAIGLAYALGFDEILLRCVCRAREMAPETRRQLDNVPSDILRIVPAEEVIDNPLRAEEGLLIIDGLLGSGANCALRPEYAELVQEMNDLRASHKHCITLAVDVPSGLGADDGSVNAPTVVADATLAIGCVKPGLLADGAEDYVGRLLCVPLPRELELPPSQANVLDSTMARLLPRRPYSCYKNRAGRVRIIAGTPGFTGAAELCSEAAVLAGAGLVELYCRADVYPILASRVRAEVMVHPITSYSEVPRDGADALLIGPGLGRPDASELPALQSLIEHPPCPLTLDADGLNLAAEHGWRIHPNSILTPHPGEMRRLFPEAAQLSRAECAARFVQQTPCTLLLKGARSIISDGAGLLYNSTGGPYMANGGQGDVLAGVITAFVAQGLSLKDAAALGAYSCGRAATTLHTLSGEPLAVLASGLTHYLTCY